MSLDLYNLTNKDEYHQVFRQSGAWVKPRGVTMINILVIGGGGGGGAGLGAASGTNRGGGSGGGGGAISRTMIPSIFLPDTLNIVIGNGGQGGTQTTAATSGGVTYVELPNGNGGLDSRVIYANGGGAGNSGTTSGAAVAGLQGVAPVTPAVYSSVSILSTSVGGAAAAGGAATGGNGSNIILGTTSLINTGGSGGGGLASTNLSTNGGQYTGSVGLSPTITWATGTSPNGLGGYFSNIPFISVGGIGGGGTNASAGGFGGNGAFGSGGGGGGGGLTTGGPGGRGGDGIVIITCF
jgi:hypothetical protein